MKPEIKEAIEDIEIVIESCEQGKDGTWDCTTDEGKQGFDDMVTLLRRAIKKLKELK